MSLDHAILGFLNYGPASGYDLKKKFDISVRHFWPADQSQIYRTLTRLTGQGWVEMVVVEQEDRPDRKLYSITEAGRAELQRWLTTPLSPVEPRIAQLIQVFFAGQLADEAILTILKQSAEQLRHLLERYAQVPQDIQSCSEIDNAREAFFWFLTLEFGVVTTQAQLEWLERAIQRNETHQISAR